MTPEELREQRISELMTSATAFFRAIEALRDRAAARENMTSTAFRALARLVEFGPKTPKELAALLATSTATITAITDSLVAQGLVMRVPNEADRRSVLLTPTAAGTTTLRTLIAHYQQVYVKCLGNMSTEKIGASGEVLNLITAGFNADLGPDEALAGEPA
ncbi:MAG: MarR family transcriptional regulator [Rhodoglobus sp.]